MANKTQPTSTSIAEFIESLDDERRQAECNQLIDLMREESGEEPVLWGPAIIGFGQYHYRYDSGREGDFMQVGFSPRKQNLSIYIIPGFEPYQTVLERLGKHKLGKSCLYIKRLEDVDTSALRELVRQSLIDMKERYPEKA
ncbi:DUF1801 domain-containing protein [Saccharospirillum alexandrii]|uniref:DUF1801 domain-containing protein n=1 Tax=Saccharospirillum alexandrii TaxID=2448477 RepID=UPI000FDB4494|nr:DUF1801 domain-containing protein [Saccharospirillum alexandrii]